MILGAEIALLYIGLYALIKGTFPISKKAKHVVRGLPARVIGVICLLPLPLAFVVSFFVAMIFVAQGREVTQKSFFWVGTVIEGSIVMSCIVAVAVLSRIYRLPVAPAPAVVDHVS